jgi:hypothetical protein
VTFTKPVSFSLGPTPLADLAGQAGGAGIAAASPVGTSRWSCSGNSLRITPTRPAGLSGAWNWRRSG